MIEIDCDTIGMELQIAREELGLSQTEVAHTIGLRQPVISNYEHGYNIPSLRQIVKMFKLYGKTLVIIDTDEFNKMMEG